MEYIFTRVVGFVTLNTFKNATKCSGYAFACGYSDAVLIRRQHVVYIVVSMPHDEFEVFKCESEDSDEEIATAFKDWCSVNCYKF